MHPSNRALLAGTALLIAFATLASPRAHAGAEHRAPASVSMCHLRADGETIATPADIRPAAAAYVCKGDDGSTIVELSEDSGHAMELHSYADGQQYLRPRPATRTDDLFRNHLIEPQSWSDDATQAKMMGEKGVDYSLAVEDVAAKLMAECEKIGTNADAPGFVWLGRIKAGGTAAYNMIVSPVATSMGACFVTKVKHTTFPEPPRPSYYDRLGGHPIAMEWESQTLMRQAAAAMNWQRKPQNSKDHQ